MFGHFQLLFPMFFWHHSFSRFFTEQVPKWLHFGSPWPPFGSLSAAEFARIGALGSPRVSGRPLGGSGVHLGSILALFWSIWPPFASFGPILSILGQFPAPQTILGQNNCWTWNSSILKKQLFCVLGVFWSVEKQFFTNA